jgi:hypothetical protein
MKRVLMRCDGARVPSTVERQSWDVDESISHRGPAAGLNINITAPRSEFDHIDGVSADLLRIAAYAFAADQQVSRGGQADVYGDSWRREFHIYLPVPDLSFWRREEVVQALQSALSFVSDDQWNFEFVAAGREPPPSNFPLNFDSSETMGDPDVVCLFSGGLDSLCSVVEQTRELGRRPALVGHSPAFHIRPRHEALYRELRRVTPGWNFPYVGGAVHRWKTDAKETTQRTRSFLYGVLGVTVASYLGVHDVQLADNGIVSLNFPINHQVLGAQATRSTHPQFIRLFNRLLELVLPDGPRVSNPLWDQTRPDTLSVLKQQGLEKLIPLTNSCAHQRGRTKSQPFCGVCSQCIDRRYGLTAAGLERHDPSERYEVDVFTHPLPEGTKRAMAYSYYAFAKDIASLSDDEIATKYPLAECIDPYDPNQGVVARQLVAMVRRHAESVVSVTRKLLRRHEADLALQRLPPSCLLALIGSQRDLESSNGAAEAASDSHRPEFIQSDDHLSVTICGTTRTVTRMQGAVLHRLKIGLDQGLPEVGWAELQRVAEGVGGSPKSMRDIFKERAVRDLFLRQSRRGVYRLNLRP